MFVLIGGCPILAANTFAACAWKNYAVAPHNSTVRNSGLKNGKATADFVHTEDMHYGWI